MDAPLAPRRSPSAHFHLSWPVSGLTRRDSHNLPMQSTVVSKDRLASPEGDDSCLPLRGQRALAWNQASRFPFNCLRRTRRRAPKRRYCKACRYKATTKAAV
jgi:hypothetical protein